MYAPLDLRFVIAPTVQQKEKRHGFARIITDQEISFFA